MKFNVTVNIIVYPHIWDTINKKARKYIKLIAPELSGIIFSVQKAFLLWSKAVVTRYYHLLYKIKNHDTIQLYRKIS